MNQAFIAISPDQTEIGFIDERSKMVYEAAERERKLVEYMIGQLLAHGYPENRIYLADHSKTICGFHLPCILPLVR